MAAATNMGQDTRDGDVVQIVTGHAREWTFLSPTCQSAVDESGIYFEAIVGTKTTSLHDPRPKTFDEDVCVSTKFENHLPTGLFTNVDHHAGATSPQHISARLSDFEGLFRRLNADTLRTKIGEDHRGKGRWAHSGHFDETQPGQRSHTQCHLTRLGPAIRLAGGALSDVRGASDRRVSRG